MDGRELMTAEARTGLAAEIEATVRATPGVRSVYRSGSLISGLLRVGAAVLGARSEDEPLVSVVFAEGAVVVEASIGVDEGARSGDTLRAVHAAVDALLDAKGVRRESLTLTVVHVQSTDV